MTTRHPSNTDPEANLTLSIDDALLERARSRAMAEGTSVNALVREFLERYAHPDARHVAMRRFLDIAAASGAGRDGAGRAWTRDDIHDQPPDATRSSPRAGGSRESASATRSPTRRPAALHRPSPPAEQRGPAGVAESGGGAVHRRPAAGARQLGLAAAGRRTGSEPVDLDIGVATVTLTPNDLAA